RSDATNLVSGDTNGRQDVFVHDRVTGTTERVSVDSMGAQGNGNSWAGSISADGRYVAFESAASNLVSGDTNAASDIFMHDRASGVTDRVRLSSSRAQANGTTHFPRISPHGRFAIFKSAASNLVSGDTNELYDVFVRDRVNGTTERVSVSSLGT